MSAHAVVLAAGAGTRLGLGPKALLPWDDGSDGDDGGGTLVTRVVREAVAAGCRVTVAAGPQADRIERVLRPYAPHVDVVRVDDAGTGMSASLRVAAAAVDASAASVVVLLVDQPGVDRRVIARLLGAHASAHAPGRAVRAVWHGVPGNPVVFDPPLLQRAAALASGDEGARAWLRAHPASVDGVECADLARGDDIDTPADLASWCRAGQPPM